MLNIQKHRYYFGKNAVEIDYRVCYNINQRIITIISFLKE